MSTPSGYEVDRSGDYNPESDWLNLEVSRRDRYSALRHLWPKGEDPKAREGAQPVLLVHAAVTGYRMFLEPYGGFLRYLLEQRNGKRPRFDLWTVDWRSSVLLAGKNGSGVQDLDNYRMENVVGDVSAALAEVHRRTERARPVHVVAHCMGAAAAAQAIATGAIGGPALGNVVLTTIALFYKQGLEGRLKVLEQMLQELAESPESKAAKLFAITPHAGSVKQEWPKEFERLFQEWKRTTYPHGCGQEFCDRLWFMFGGDYRAEDMMELHDGEGDHGLQEHFGAMPLGLYQHIEQNCTRGWAAPFISPGSPDKWDPGDSDKDFENEDYVGDEAAERFRAVDLTLIAPNEGQVWHRESIDRMFEWAQRHELPRVRKRVFDRFGHIDLWWGSKAHEIVYPYILAQLPDL
jgi:pimeloyl-ACP methyl ester carboxylesterase